MSVEFFVTLSNRNEEKLTNFFVFCYNIVLNALKLTKFTSMVNHYRYVITMFRLFSSNERNQSKTNRDVHTGTLRIRQSFSNQSSHSILLTICLSFQASSNCKSFCSDSID